MSDDIFEFQDDKNESHLEKTQINNTHDGNAKFSASWKVLIADDEPSIHEVTILALKDVHFENKPIEFLHAYSGKQTIEILKQHPDTALLLLDVVMETDESGLAAVDIIRNTLDNQSVRIILRTGQPGHAPELDVIQKYDINDYKEKTELTSKKLFTTVYTALRSYSDIVRLEQSRQGLEKIINATADIFRLQSMEQLVSGVLMQVMSIIGIDEGAFYGHSSSFISIKNSQPEQNNTNNMVIISGTGRFENMTNQPVNQTLAADVIQHINTAYKEKRSVFTDDSCIVYLRNHSLIYIDGYKKLNKLEQSLLDIFSANVTVAFENVELNEEILETQKEVIFTLGSTTEFRSNETGNHIARVSEMSRKLAILAGLTEDDAELIRLASPMHDVGKIGIPDNILLKPDKLTVEEFEVMKTHTTIGYDILKHSSRPIFQAAATIAYQHQEKWDGSGYPRGLSGMDIHIFGRIIAIVDVFDALSSSRCYKEAWSAADIKKYFNDQKSKHFDPQLVEIFINNYDSFTEFRIQLGDD
ncbi:MAG: DUF3369 domain-containing protein [Gammaproteobacteria bacterium]|nr:DUF3369 domain-containing protein [Gammaproteobacteria bacterium]